jgi:hypothetical protein
MGTWLSTLTVSIFAPVEHEGRHMKRLLTTAVLFVCMAAPTAAIGLRQVIRDCGPDGKMYCKGVGYGAPMQACLSRNKEKLTPVCRAVIDRLDKGEKVTLFGG